MSQEEEYRRSLDVQRQTTQDLQNSYVDEFYRAPHEKKNFRKINHITQSYFKNWKIYYIILIVAVILYFADRYLEIQSKLASATIESGNLLDELVAKVQGEVNFTKARKWSNATLVVITFLLLLLAYGLKLIGEKQYIKYKVRKDQWLLEQRRLKNSSCKRVSKQEYDMQTIIHTKEQLQKLFNSDQYQQYMNHREDLDAPELNDQLEYHTDSEHDMLLDELL